MSKYVFINVQGISDVTTGVFESGAKLYDYLEYFFEDDENYSPDDLMPFGRVFLDYQTLIVVEVE